jgi:hypothetical protein
MRIFGEDESGGFLKPPLERREGDGQIFVALLVGIINTRTVDYFFDDIIKDFPSFRWR